MMLRMVAVALAGCGLAVGLAVGLAACGDDRAGPPTVDLAQMTVEQAYARMAEGMTREGQVLRTRVSTGSQQSSDGEVLPYATTDLWIDTSAQSLREEFHLDPSVDDYDLAKEYTLIVRDGQVYVPDDPGEALRHDVESFCPGSDNALVAYLLGCADLDLQEVAASIETRFDADREYEGRAAAALVFDVKSEAHEGTITVYIDPATFLPISRINEATTGAGWPRLVVSYEHEFVDAGSLDATFLDPHSIGYGAEDEQGKLDAIAQEVPVWWLGDEVDPGGGLPELVLVRIFQDDPGYFKESWKAGGHLIYETPDGLKGVDVFLWTPGDFDAFMGSDSGAVLNDPLCVSRSALSVRGEEVPLYAIPWPEPPVNTSPKSAKEACPIRIVNAMLQQWSYMAVVRMAGVVVDVRADVGGDFRSEEAMRMLVSALRARPAAAPGAPVATRIPTRTPVPPPPGTPVLITVLPAVTATPAR
jgi:hypothetical protein